MEIKRRQFTLASMASRLVSATESAGLASMATFASALWVGLALPGLPLLPGLGAGGNNNVAISLSSAVLGVQESQTFKSPNNATGRQARLLSLLLPADALANDLASAPPRSAESRAKSLIVALPDPPAAENHESGPSATDQPQRQVASAPVEQSQPAPQPPAPAPPAPHPATPAVPRHEQPDPNPPAPGPSTPSTPPPSSDTGEPVVAPPPADGGEGPLPADPGAPESPESPDPAGPPGNGNPEAGGATTNPGGNNPNAGGNNPNAGGNNPNAGGNNPNAGGNNAGGNGNGNGNAGGNNPNAGGANAGGNGNGNGAAKGGPKKGP
jgi:hypothetical protein